MVRKVAKRILSKKKILNMDYMGFVLEAAVSSCQFGSIREYQGGRDKYHLERANTNVVLALPLGAGKTTNLLQIGDAVMVNDVTFPGMVGSINKEGDFVPGATIKAAGKVLILDEFNKVPRDVKDAMNNLLEQRAHPRNLGFKVLRPVNKKSKFYQIKVKENYIYVKSRFSCIASTMYLKLRESRNMSDIAWFTRFIPIRFVPGIDYYEKMSRGEKVLTINPRVKNVETFYFKKYLKAAAIFWDAVKAHPKIVFFEKNAFDRGALIRMLQNTVRLAAFVATLYGRNKIRLKDFHKTVRFLPMMLTHYTSCGLSEHEAMTIERWSAGKMQQEIADEIGISQPAVSKIITKLKMRGLIASR